MQVDLLGLGVAAPPHRVTQDEALKLSQDVCCHDARQQRWAQTLYQHSGVSSRSLVLPLSEAYRWAPRDGLNATSEPNLGPTTADRMAYYQEHALPLAVRAAGEALRRSGCRAEDITHVVTASCTGFTAPGVDSGVIEQLQLNRSTERIHVGYMGCHGAINALRAAHGLACTDPSARVLACCVELCSLHYAFYWDTERMLGNALFADGAGALVIGQRDANHSGRSDSRHWRLAATGSFLFPDTADAMTWSIGNHGFAMTISSQVPTLISKNLGGWLAEWLKRQGLSASDVASWAIHPGGPRIVEAAAEAMKLPSQMTDASREVLAEYGNMSSATVLFVLDLLQRRGAEPPCVMIGFGPGLVAEVALWA